MRLPHDCADYLSLPLWCAMSRWIVAAGVLAIIFALISWLEDGYSDEKIAAQYKREAIMQARVNAAETQREYKRLAAEAKYMTGFAMVSK